MITHPITNEHSCPPRDLHINCHAHTYLLKSELGKLSFKVRDGLKRTWSRETRLDRQNQGFDTPTPQIVAGSPTCTKPD